MPHQLTKLTPSLIVSDVARSVAFYRDVLGFRLDATVPEQAPYVFAIVQSGGVEIFLNAPEPAATEYPAFKERSIGGTLTLFIEVVGIADAYESLKDRVPVVMVAREQLRWLSIDHRAGFLLSHVDGVSSLEMILDVSGMPVETPATAVSTRTVCRWIWSVTLSPMP